MNNQTNVTIKNAVGVDVTLRDYRMTSQPFVEDQVDITPERMGSLRLDTFELVRKGKPEVEIQGYSANRFSRGRRDSSKMANPSPMLHYSMGFIEEKLDLLEMLLPLLWSCSEGQN